MKESKHKEGSNRKKRREQDSRTLNKTTPIPRILASVTTKEGAGLEE